MVYVSKDGKVQDSQSWSIWSIPAYFWGVVNFVVLFFKTLIQPNHTRLGPDYQTDYRKPGGGGGGGGPTRRMGGFGRRNDGPSAPPMSGGG